MLAHVSDVGAHFSAALANVRHDQLAGVRGKGLWLALALNQANSAAVESAGRRKGFLVNAVQPDAVRLAPPLVLTKEQADEFVGALPDILDAAAHEES